MLYLNIDSKNNYFLGKRKIRQGVDELERNLSKFNFYSGLCELPRNVHTEDLLFKIMFYHATEL